MDKIQEILKKFNTAQSSEPFDAKAFAQLKVDCENRREGNLHTIDGYDCPICKNKGHIMKVEEYRGSYIEVVADCKCSPIRKSIMRMKRSGLEDVIKKYTFDKFVAEEPWQKSVKEQAMAFCENPEGWFFIGGQSGCGKTHICTAICRELLLAGNEVYYMKWRDDVSKLKAMALDAEEREQTLNKIKNTAVLYIDDLFKTGRNPDGSEPKPTSADINLAFEIINHRYCKKGLITIFSSEMEMADIINIDEATGGRICEKAITLSIAKDRSRNYRTRNATTI
jgi:DNA replication protein DnaC